MGLINSKRNSDEAKYCVPNGLYPSCAWDLKTVKKLVLEKKLAPFYPGVDDRTTADHDECPICFLYYPGGLNRAKCCKKGICTECFLQIKKPGFSPIDSTCPFCNQSKFTVVFVGPKTLEERTAEEREEQKVRDLQQRMREEELKRDRQREKQRKKQANKGKEKDRKKKEAKKRKIKVGGDEFKKKDRPAKEELRDSSSGAKDLKHSDQHKKRSKKLNEQSDVPEQTEHVRSMPGPSPEIGEDPGASSPPSHQPLVYPSGSSPEKDLEELMLLEAIRLSLMESDGKQRAEAPKENPKPNEEGTSSALRVRNSRGLFGDSDEEGGEHLKKILKPKEDASDKEKAKDREKRAEEERDKEKELELETKNASDDDSDELLLAKIKSNQNHRQRTASITVDIKDTPLGSGGTSDGEDDGSDV